MWSTRHQISGFGFGAFNLKESAFLYRPLLSETPLVWKRGSVINSASHKSSTGRPISPKFNIWVCPEELSCTWLLWSLLACECQCWCYRHGKALLRDAVLVLLMLQQGTVFPGSQKSPSAAWQAAKSLADRDWERSLSLLPPFPFTPPFPFSVPVMSIHQHRLWNLSGSS